MAYYKATVDILIEVPDDEPHKDGYAADAIAETMRPLLREFAGPESCWIDWKYQFRDGAYQYAQPDDGLDFEYKD